MEPIIKFNGYSIKSINYIRIEEEELADLKAKIENPQDKMNDLERRLSIGVTSDLKQALLTLYAKVYDLDKQRVVECEVHGQFEIMKEMSEKEIQEHVSSSGMGILYPYLRSIISIITTLDSTQSILIPTINPHIYE